MSKQDSLQGALDLMVLKILSRTPRQHGYAIMTAIEDISRGVLRVEEGSLYPALRRMEEAGWLRGEWITRDAGRRARVYQLSAARQEAACGGGIALGGGYSGGESRIEDGLNDVCMVAHRKRVPVQPSGSRYR